MASESWPDRVRQAMVEPQNFANMNAAKYEQMGDDVRAFRLRVFGRINGIEDALIELSRQLEEVHLASR